MEKKENELIGNRPEILDRLIVSASLLTGIIDLKVLGKDQPHHFEFPWTEDETSTTGCIQLKLKNRKPYPDEKLAYMMTLLKILRDHNHITVQQYRSFKGQLRKQGDSILLQKYLKKNFSEFYENYKKYCDRTVDGSKITIDMSNPGPIIAAIVDNDSTITKLIELMGGVKVC